MTTSSTWIIACRSGKRWFDLDAVRTEPVRGPRPNETNRTGVGHGGPLREGATTPGLSRPEWAGAPPLDWHSDLPDPAGTIRLADDFYSEHDQSNASAIIERTEEDMTLRYIVGDTRDATATIEDGTVDLIFTSPPFLALRSYLPADHEHKHREIGSEANPAAFLDVLLQLTAEWGRVLAPHGTLAVELGDTYSGSSEAGWQRDKGEYRREVRSAVSAAGTLTGAKRATGWPLAKSLAGIPQLYMIALAYGINPLTGQPSPAGRWRVRNWLAWHRPNPPVGALGDKWRPASSYITVACKGAKRWFDLDAVRHEPVNGDDDRSTRAVWQVTGSRHDDGLPFVNGGNPAGAPPLDWHVDGDLGVGHIILSTQPYPGSHYATFPVDLPRKIIDCMCPRQVCRVCGVARERVTENPNAGTGSNQYQAAALNPTGIKTWDRPHVAERETLGWSDCGHDSWRPGIVYDPFAGSGTTLEAAQDLGRDGIGADLDERNAWLARERLGMFAEFDTLHPSTVDIVSDLL